jgi:hypothetical protein
VKIHGPDTTLSHVLELVGSALGQRLDEGGSDAAWERAGTAHYLSEEEVKEVGELAPDRRSRSEGVRGEEEKGKLTRNARLASRRRLDDLSEEDIELWSALLDGAEPEVLPSHRVLLVDLVKGVWMVLRWAGFDGETWGGVGCVAVAVAAWRENVEDRSGDVKAWERAERKMIDGISLGELRWKGRMKGRGEWRTDIDVKMRRTALKKRRELRRDPGGVLVVLHNDNEGNRSDGRLARFRGFDEAGEDGKRVGNAGAACEADEIFGTGLVLVWSGSNWEAEKKGIDSPATKTTLSYASWEWTTP